MGRRRHNKRNNQFWESFWSDNYIYQYYYNWLSELAISVFEWKNLPDSINPAFLELTLFNQGKSVFFYDDAIGFLALQATTGGPFNVYNIPIRRNVYASNGYHRRLNGNNSVIIWNNNIHTPTRIDIDVFAKQLYNIHQTININVNAQKTPVIIQCDENQRLTMENMLAQYEGNIPFIWGDSKLDLNSVKVIDLKAPYVADRLQQLKTNLVNEALDYLGIPNVSVVKKERLNEDEVNRNMGSTNVRRFSRLDARRWAAEEINRKYNLNISVDYRQDIVELQTEINGMVGGAVNGNLYDRN